MSETLRHLQFTFLEAFQQGIEQKPDILREIVSYDHFNAKQRWMVYRDSITAAFMNTLETIFPVCKKLVGKQFFVEMSKIAIAEMPSHSPDLNDYGDRLPDFIANFEHAKSLPYLADVAHLEWAVHLANNGPDIEVMDYELLTQWVEQKGDQLVFQLPANGSLLQSTYPIDKIWQVNQEEHEGDETVCLENDACNLLVWRQAYNVILVRLDDQQYYVMQQFAACLPLETIFENTLAHTIDIEKVLLWLVQRGYLTNFQ